MTYLSLDPVRTGGSLGVDLGWGSTRRLGVGGGGWAQRPGWPNLQLPFRNLLFYDAQTLWILVKTYSDQILAKLINQEGGGWCCCSFLIETSQKFWKWKNFLLLENFWNWHGSQFWVEKNDSGHKNLSFLRLKPLSMGNIWIWWLIPFFRGNSVTSYLQK